MRTASAMRRLGEAVLEVVFPAHCTHCSQDTGNIRKAFCSVCTDLFTLIEPQERCRGCFHSLNPYGPCSICFHRSRLIKACASAFDYYGPASTLIREFKFNGRFAFAKDAAAFMMVQLSRLNWPMPDALIPVPQTLTSWLKRGYNQSSLIAQELSRMINVPVVDILKKSFTEFSQTGLDRQQRNRLSAEAFGLKRKSIPPNQTLLLIDDVLTTGATLQSCAAVLHQTFPSAVYALTFAHNSET